MKKVVHVSRAARAGAVDTFVFGVPRRSAAGKRQESKQRVVRIVKAT
jgi:hypothetical protein